uniref:Uncharacterized protein n=1 Tax=Rhizophora mucronata TaxID=61149 RepID=A0A2P2J290_RHIMU
MKQKTIDTCLNQTTGIPHTTTCANELT